MPSVLPKNKELSFSKLLTFLAICLLLVLSNNLGLLSTLKSSGIIVGSNLSEPFKSKLNEIDKKFQLIKDKEDLILELNLLKKENEKLLSLNTSLKIENGDLELIQKQKQFSEIPEGTPALVLGTVLDEFGYIVINKGEVDGIKKGSSVVIKNYLIGEVTEVGKYTSEVRMIISPNGKVPVTSILHNAHGVVQGNVSRGLLMEDVSQGSILEEEEVIITSGINSKFVRGLIVGKVKKINQVSNSVTKSAEIDSLIDFSELDRVFILEPNDVL